jgi:hypothetical protein
VSASSAARIRDLYELDLHERAFVWNDTYEAMRVPGGWLYTYFTNRGPCMAFVPFHNEFQKVSHDIAF